MPPGCDASRAVCTCIDTVGASQPKSRIANRADASDRDMLCRHIFAVFLSISQ